VKLFKLVRQHSPLRSLFLLFLVTLHGCSLIPKEPTITNTVYDWPSTEAKLRKLNHWSLFGKLGIRTEADSITAAINKWVQTEDQFEIDISSTFFGLGSSKLLGNPNFLSIFEPGEEPVSSFEPDELMESALGIPLPISYLSNWVKALPVKGITYSQTLNNQGLPESLTQDNWTLTFSNYHTDHNLPLPGKIKIQRDNIRIILAVKEWTIH
jgi:outer membrane lipoprotein LolB